MIINIVILRPFLLIAVLSFWTFYFVRFLSHTWINRFLKTFELRSMIFSVCLFVSLSFIENKKIPSILQCALLWLLDHYIFFSPSLQRAEKKNWKKCPNFIKYFDRLVNIKRNSIDIQMSQFINLLFSFVAFTCNGIAFFLWNTTSLLCEYSIWICC